MPQNYQQFINPFLQIANDTNSNQVNRRDVINQPAYQFSLSNEAE